MRAVPRLCIIIYTPAFALQLRKNYGKTSVMVAEKCLTAQCWARFVQSSCGRFMGCLDWPVTDVPRCTSSNAKTRGLNHLQFPDLRTGSGPPDWAPLVHHGTNELTVKHNTIPYRQSTPHVQNRPQHSQPLGSFLPNLVDVRRPGQPCVWDHSQITGSIDPLDWLTRKFVLVGVSGRACKWRASRCSSRR